MRTNFLIIEGKEEAFPKQRGRNRVISLRILLQVAGFSECSSSSCEMVYPLHCAGDHYFSEALILADPDGNGIEIYQIDPKRVWRDWEWSSHLLVNPLAVKNYLQQGSTWSGFQAVLWLGQYSFSIVAIREAKTFLLVDGLGLSNKSQLVNGALFCIKQVAIITISFNTWQVKGTTAQMPFWFGLNYFTIVLADEKQKEPSMWKA